ncbi:hypothetical protein C8Q77DRAFT_1073404 [Trametes polyzona]|nr:hypothetical protein C8Q77DRAFT_1073404 [Trametes polyzona]
MHEAGAGTSAKRWSQMGNEARSSKQRAYQSTGRAPQSCQKHVQGLRPAATCPSPCLTPAPAPAPAPPWQLAAAAGSEDPARVLKSPMPSRVCASASSGQKDGADAEEPGTRPRPCRGGADFKLRAQPGDLRSASAVRWQSSGPMRGRGLAVGRPGHRSRGEKPQSENPREERERMTSTSTGDEYGERERERELDRDRLTGAGAGEEGGSDQSPDADGPLSLKYYGQRPASAGNARTHGERPGARTPPAALVPRIAFAHPFPLSPSPSPRPHAAICAPIATAPPNTLDDSAPGRRAASDPYDRAEMHAAHPGRRLPSESGFDAAPPAGALDAATGTLVYTTAGSPACLPVPGADTPHVSLASDEERRTSWFATSFAAADLPGDNATTLHAPSQPSQTTRRPTSACDGAGVQGCTELRLAPSPIHTADSGVVNADEGPVAVADIKASERRREGDSGRRKQRVVG